MTKWVRMSVLIALTARKLPLSPRDLYITFHSEPERCGNPRAGTMTVAAVTRPVPAFAATTVTQRSPPEEGPGVRFGSSCLAPIMCLGLGPGDDVWQRRINIPLVDRAGHGIGLAP